MLGKLVIHKFLPRVRKTLIEELSIYIDNNICNATFTIEGVIHLDLFLEKGAL